MSDHPKHARFHPPDQRVFGRYFGTSNWVKREGSGFVCNSHLYIWRKVHLKKLTELLYRFLCQCIKKSFFIYVRDGLIKKQNSINLNKIGHD